MKQTARIISTYSADTFGVCSALFELDGMVVMHDPSGCNSTYTTHDEPRWYDMDSRIYISGLTEYDAIMGDDKKLIREVVETALAQQPRFIALLATPVPTMVGTDLAAVARLVEQETGIPCFTLATNSMHFYTLGISLALGWLAEQVVQGDAYGGKVPLLERSNSGSHECDPYGEKKQISAKESSLPLWASKRTDFEGEQRRAKECECCAELRGTASAVDEVGCPCNNKYPSTTGNNPPKINLLGVTPLDFAMNGSERSMQAWLEREGFALGACWARGASLDDILASGSADVNLVVSAGGLLAARVLEAELGIPYVVGTPLGAAMQECLAQAIRLSAADGKSRLCAGSDTPCFVSVSGSRTSSTMLRMVPLPQGGRQGDPYEGKLPLIAEHGAPCGADNIPVGACRSKPVATTLLPRVDNPRRVPLAGLAAKGHGAVNPSPQKGAWLAIGDSVFMQSLAAAVTAETGQAVQVICPVETDAEIVLPETILATDEAELEPYLSEAAVIIADPMYEPICPPTAKFVALPHVGFSGRLRLGDIPNLVEGAEEFIAKELKL